MAEPKLRAEWFWTDRWFASSACCLPIDARGLYRELLTRSWSLGGKLPNNPQMLMRLAGVTEEEWRRCWPLVAPYWNERDGHLTNETQLEVMADARKRQQVRTERAKKAAQARWGQCSSNAQASAKQCPPSPSPSLSKSLSLEPSQEETKGVSETSSPRSPDKPASRNGADYSDAFLAFWTAYPRKKAKGAAWKAWKRTKDRPSLPDVLSAVERAKASKDWQKDGGEFIPHPATWINARGWEDEPDAAPPEKPLFPSWHLCHGHNRMKPWKVGVNGKEIQLVIDQHGQPRYRRQGEESWRLLDSGTESELRESLTS